MSNPLLAKLPRFDVPRDLPPGEPGKSWLRDLSPDGEAGGDNTVRHNPSHDFSEPDQESIDKVEMAESDLEVEEPQAAPAPVEAFDALNVSLTEVIAQLGQEAHQQAIAGIQEIAAQLFPKMADIFLADELAHHLPGLIPKLAPHVEIAAPPGLSVRLQNALARTNALPPNCRFVEADDGQPANAIRIMWPNGGYDYDFNILLADCLAHVGAQAEKTEK